ncbi:WXG100 family type VII secretion target [Jatrophihabitans endophyticus]|uniref:WXG100 family type VII secretion target n=1 Tax=Jatrophihabitans endophyticus TaxID=1206085 RepID=A0A1M5HZB9_9ACTN|nr:WXG100 family type VII secretion target [Jatrophihabitans endophyticus]SHG21297.1 WXG100 family type VII secretion target [Jatrophihabitans endophyticus]
MTSFAVDTDLLAELVRRMAACGTRLEEVAADVDARMTRVHAVWRGVAAGEQADAHRRWAAGARQTHEALAALRAVATTADENYRAAAHANVRMWAQ